MAETDKNYSTELRHGVITTVPLAFMVIAAAAPLGATAGNTPLIYALGNGIAAPFDFVLVGILLILFAVGFTAMSTHVTNAGAFYTYISMGIGKRLGGAAGYVAVFAYNLLTVYCSCVGGFYLSDILNTEFGLVIPWWISTLVLTIIIFMLGYFGIEGGVKFLMVCLVCEVAILAATDIAVIVNHGIQSFTLECFSMEAFLSGAPGLGIAFAFLCFIGFEATAIFGEEAKEPRKTVPRATYFAVVFVGVVYSFSAWAAVASLGPEQTLAMANSDEISIIFHTVVVSNLGDWAGHVFNLFFILSAVASWLAAHNMSSRYLYAFARGGMLPKALSRTHARFKSPYVAEIVQVTFSLAIVFIAFAFGFDPYTQTGAFCSAVAIVGIMVLELLVCVAVIGYFRAHNNEPGYHHNVFATTIAPIIALVGLAWLTYMVISNFGLMTGIENDALNMFIACIMIIIGIIGFIVSAYKQSKGTLIDVTSIDLEEDISDVGNIA